ncbi:hypothetical protein Q9L58_010583, partial [Maublancomyces gigas]
MGIAPSKGTLQYIRSISFDLVEKLSSTHERIPSLTVKLVSKADYADWLDATEAMLDYSEILEVVQGTEKSPEDILVSGNNASAIAQEVHREMQKPRIATEMSKAVEDLVDRKTTSTLHEMVGNLMTL